MVTTPLLVRPGVDCEAFVATAVCFDHGTHELLTARLRRCVSLFPVAKK